VDNRSPISLIASLPSRLCFEELESSVSFPRGKFWQKKQIMKLGSWVVWAVILFIATVNLVNGEEVKPFFVLSNEAHKITFSTVSVSFIFYD
jgi:hypothetical protein